MKKTLLVLALAACLAPVALFGQAKLENSSGATIQVSIKGDKSYILYPNSSLTTSFRSPNGQVEFRLIALIAGSQKDLGYFSRALEKGKLVITDADLSRPGAASFAALSAPAASSAPSAAARAASAYPSASSSAEWCFIIDSTDNRLEMLEAPFRGIALKAGQKSKDSVLVPRGLLQTTLLYDIDPDENSTGRNYAQAVYSKIIVQSQKFIVIKEADLLFSSFSSGGQRKFILVNKFPFKVVVTGGPFAGAAISPDRRWQGKKELMYGFNSYSIQYIRNGIKYQANWELIATPSDCVLYISPETVSGEIAIK